MIIWGCTPIFASPKFLKKYAEVAHLVEHDLAKVGVAGSSPVFRSKKAVGSISHSFFIHLPMNTRVVELVDTQDLKSCGQQWLYGFNSRPGYITASISGAVFLFTQSAKIMLLMWPCRYVPYWKYLPFFPRIEN